MKLNNANPFHQQLGGFLATTMHSSNGTFCFTMSRKLWIIWDMCMNAKNALLWDMLYQTLSYHVVLFLSQSVLLHAACGDYAPLCSLKTSIQGCYNESTSVCQAQRVKRRQNAAGIWYKTFFIFRWTASKMSSGIHLTVGGQHKSKITNMAFFFLKPSTLYGKRKKRLVKTLNNELCWILLRHYFYSFFMCKVQDHGWNYIINIACALQLK